MSKNTTFERVKKEWSKWPSLPAVKNQRIHLEDSNLFDRPTARLVDDLENLARHIHLNYSAPYHSEKKINLQSGKILVIITIVTR